MKANNKNKLNQSNYLKQPIAMSKTQCQNTIVIQTFG